MTWVTIIGILLQLFGPLIRKWLENLLKRAASETQSIPLEYALESPGAYRHTIDDVFGRAEEELWWFQFTKKRALALVHRAALHRGEEMRKAVRLGTPLSPLTAGELTEQAQITGE